MALVRAGSPEELAEFLVGRHPGTAAVFRHMTYSHLPANLRPYSAPICGLAAQMVDLLPDGPELTAGLRKLLEAKDCFVRAGVDLVAAVSFDDPLLLIPRLESDDNNGHPAGAPAGQLAELGLGANEGGGI